MRWLEHWRPASRRRILLLLAAIGVAGGSAIGLFVADDGDDRSDEVPAAEPAPVRPLPELTVFATSETVQRAGGPPGLATRFARTSRAEAVATFRPDEPPRDDRERSVLLVVVDGGHSDALTLEDGARQPEIVLLHGRYLVLVYAADDPALVLDMSLSDEPPRLDDVEPLGSMAMPAGPLRA